MGRGGRRKTKLNEKDNKLIKLPTTSPLKPPLLPPSALSDRSSPPPLLSRDYRPLPRACARTCTMYRMMPASGLRIQYMPYCIYKKPCIRCVPFPCPRELTHVHARACMRTREGERGAKRRRDLELFIIIIIIIIIKLLLLFIIS